MIALTGVYVPLVTPFYRGQFDPKSLAQLIEQLSPHVAGFVPCLSSGEGQLLSDSDWEAVIRMTRQQTQKPVIAGVKRDRLEDTLRLSAKAAEIGCDAVILPVPCSDEDKVVEYFETVAEAIALPIVLYNTEEHSVQTAAGIRRLEAIPRIIGIKDSSMNQPFFEALCKLRYGGDLRLSVLQGFEHLLKVPAGCDGYLIALANLEPELCQRMFQKNSVEIAAEIEELFWRYNLGGDWFVSMKALLAARQMIRSAEQVNPAIVP